MGYTGLFAGSPDMKLKYLLLLSCSLVSMLCPVAGAAPSALKNPGFEESPDRPVGWIVSQHAGVQAYRTEIDKKQKADGKHSFRIERQTKQTYGLISQRVAVKGADGKTMRLTASLRTRKVGPRGWLLVVNFVTGTGAIISQARSKPLTGDTDWKTVILEQQVPAQTAQLSIGVMLLDGGTGWVDSVSLQLTDK